MLKRIGLLVVLLAVLWSPGGQAAPKQIGKTDVGKLYILTETIREAKVGEDTFVFAASEEEYTNSYFIARLQQHPRFKNVEYCWNFYVFNEKQKTYNIGLIVYVDGHKVPVLEREVKEPSQTINSNKEARQVYKAAKRLLGK